MKERQFGKYTLKIRQDDSPESPREWDNNFGNMICFHSRYDLGDKHHWRDPDEFLNGLCELADPKWESYLDWLDNAGYQKARRIVLSVEPTIDPSKIHERATGLTYHWLQKRRDATLNRHYIMLPLYLYDHSGITMNTTGFSCRWDSGPVGWIYADRKTAVAEYGAGRSPKNLTKKIRKAAENMLRAEVHTYDQYLTGDVWGFMIDSDVPEEEDSCWGFYGEVEAEREGLRALLFMDCNLPMFLENYGLMRSEADCCLAIDKAYLDGWLDDDEYEFFVDVLSAYATAEVEQRREEMWWRVAA